MKSTAATATSAISHGAQLSFLRIVLLILLELSSSSVDALACWEHTDCLVNSFCSLTVPGGMYGSCVDCDTPDGCIDDRLFDITVDASSDTSNNNNNNNNNNFNCETLCPVQHECNSHSDCPGGDEDGDWWCHRNHHCEPCSADCGAGVQTPNQSIDGNCPKACCDWGYTRGQTLDADHLHIFIGLCDGVDGADDATTTPRLDFAAGIRVPMTTELHHTPEQYLSSSTATSSSSANEDNDDLVIPCDVQEHYDPLRFPSRIIEVDCQTTLERQQDLHRFCHNNNDSGDNENDELEMQLRIGMVVTTTVSASGQDTSTYSTSTSSFVNEPFEMTTLIPSCADEEDKHSGKDNGSWRTSPSYVSTEDEEDDNLGAFSFHNSGLMLSLFLLFCLCYGGSKVHKEHHRDPSFSDGPNEWQLEDHGRGDGNTECGSDWGGDGMEDDDLEKNPERQSAVDGPTTTTVDPTEEEPLSSPALSLPKQEENTPPALYPTVSTPTYTSSTSSSSSSEEEEESELPEDSSNDHESIVASDNEEDIYMDDMEEQHE